jgi:predicted DNA-binding transcriptional regulator YafY
MTKKDTSGNPRDTAIRYISMLSHIPMEPNDISTAELESRLEGENFVVDRRTIQRDLERLSDKFPLNNRPGAGRELRWFFKKGTANQWPAMNTDTALTLLMAEQNLKPLIPKQAFNSLASLVNQAKETLKVQDKSGSKKIWSDSVRIVSKGFALQPADIAPDVMTNIFDAMGKHRQLKITNKAGKESVINPLGLVMRGPMLYLVSNYHGYDDIRINALHRITSATVEMSDLVTPKDFNLDDILQSGLMSWRLDPGKPKNFEIFVNEDIARYLDENRINLTQTIKKHDDGSALVKFTSEDTLELRQWLLGFGAGVVVNKPAAVQKWIMGMGREIVELYSD